MAPATATLAALATFKPALKPPPGVTPNPENPESLAHLATITIALCIPLMTIFFLLRSYVRLIIRRVWIFEDYLVTITWAGAMAYCGIMRGTMAHHGGEHGWDISAGEAHQAAFWFNICAVEYGVMIGITKLCVLLLYRRVFCPMKHSPLDITILVLIALMIGFYGSTSLVKIFSCTPRERIWNKTIPGHCVNMAWILNTSGAFNTVTDYIILLLPVRAVWNMQMDSRKKVLVVLVFTFGLCAPVFATIGFVVRLKNSANPDSTWKQPEILLWGAAELTSGLLCVCFPEMGALLPRTRQQISKASGNRRKPTASEIQRWNNDKMSSFRKSRKSNRDPYTLKSLNDTSAECGPYIELDETGHDVQISRVRSEDRLEEPMDGVVMMKNEIKIERHEVL